MSVLTQSPGAPAQENSLTAVESFYRLAAVLLGYPLAETQQALEDGRLQQALDEAWRAQTGDRWPAQSPCADLDALEVGYMATFVHGRRGQPRVPLVGSAYDSLLAGETPGSYMLNVRAFYRHFDLQTARGDEGHTEEPDHLVTMLEFCALLCHLEARALGAGQDASAYRRARRDFITRYLSPLLHAVKAAYVRASGHGLDATLAQLIDTLPAWADRRREALEEQVGPCPAPGAIPASQAMWD